MKKNEKKTDSWVFKELYELCETILISLLVVSLVFTYVLRLSTVEGSSMNDTFASGDKVLALKNYGIPKNGDVVLAFADKAVTLDESDDTVTGEGINKVIIKRVIAVGGQTLDIDFVSGIVTVDGKELFEDYVTGLTHNDEGAFTDNYPFVIPDGYVFVMGDNRRISKDSRSSEIGLIPADDIIGKVIFRFYPFDKIGKTN